MRTPIRPTKMFALFVWVVLLYVGVEHRAAAEPQAASKTQLDPHIFEMLFKNGAFKEGIHQRTPLDEETSRMTREEMYSGWIVCKDEGIKGMTS